MMKWSLVLLLCFKLFADDFTLPRGMHSDEQIFIALSETFKGKPGDYYTRSIKRVGGNTIMFEAMIYFDADPKIMTKVLSNLEKYNDWSLTNINKAPGSNMDYFLKIYRFIYDPKQPNSLRPEFMVDIPGFRKITSRKFDVITEQKKGVFTITGETPDEPRSHIERATTRLKMFPTHKEDRLWLYVTARVKLRHWLLYEALPTRLLEKQSMERIQVVLDNYQVEEAKIKSLVGKN